MAGPEALHESVKTAIRQYKCEDDGTGTEISITQEFNFVFEKPPKPVFVPESPISAKCRESIYTKFEAGGNDKYGRNMGGRKIATLLFSAIGKDYRYNSYDYISYVMTTYRYDSNGGLVSDSVLTSMVDCVYEKQTNVIKGIERR